MYSVSEDDVPFSLYFLIQAKQHPHNAYDQHCLYHRQRDRLSLSTEKYTMFHVKHPFLQYFFFLLFVVRRCSPAHDTLPVQHFRCPLVATTIVRRGFTATCFRCGTEVLFSFVVKRSMGMGRGMGMGLGMGVGMGLGASRKSFVRPLGESRRRAASRGSEGGLAVF